MQNRINYFLLLIIIILGVAAGNVLSHWINNKYFKEKSTIQIVKEPITVPKTATKPAIDPAIENRAQESTTPRETVKLSPNNQSNLKVEDPLLNTKEQIELRKLDENGIRLAKKCSEWTVVHKDMNTDSSKRGMNKHCDQYYDYISFGTLPEPN